MSDLSFFPYRRLLPHFPESIPVQWPHKLHPSLLCHECDDGRVDWLIVGHQAQLLPPESDLGVTDRCELVELIHVSEEGVR